jgi:hypothetical protein
MEEGKKDREEEEEEESMQERHRRLSSDRLHPGHSDLFSPQKQVEQTRGSNWMETKSVLVFAKMFEKFGQYSQYFASLYVFLLGLFLLLLFLVLISPDTGFNPLPFQFAPPNSPLFQVANVFFLASYWSPNVLFLRITLGMGCVLFGAWAAAFQPLPLADTVLWQAAATLINLRHALQLFYAKRPIIFDEHREKVYTGLFASFMTRADFRTLTKGALIRTLRKERCYAMVGDVISSLAILVSGRIQVLKVKGGLRRQQQTESEPVASKAAEAFQMIRDGTFMYECQFIDSPEWLLRSSGEALKYEVDLVAEEDCIYLMWPRETLLELTRNHPELHPPLLAALGIDVSRKIFANN